MMIGGLWRVRGGQKESEEAQVRGKNMECIKVETMRLKRKMSQLEIGHP